MGNFSISAGGMNIRGRYLENQQPDEKEPQDVAGGVKIFYGGLDFSLKEERGKGYAKLLVNAASTFAKDHEITEIILHAQLTARGLYEKLNFIPEGAIFEEAGIQHITMRKTI